MAWQPDYTTTADLKSFIRVTDTADDAEMALAITAASRAIDRATRRQFGQVTTAAERFYTAYYDTRRHRWRIDIDDLMDDTDLAIDYDSDGDETYVDAIDAYALQPVNAAADQRPWTRIVVRTDSTNQPDRLENGVRITALWGWDAVPTTIEQACLLQASRLLARRDSPFGVAGSPDMGSEVRLLSKLDPDVAVVVSPYRRVAAVG